MMDAHQLGRLLKAIESIAESLTCLAPIQLSLESLADSAYELNEKLDALTGAVEGSDGERTFIRTLDIGRD